MLKALDQSERYYVRHTLVRLDLNCEVHTKLTSDGMGVTSWTVGGTDYVFRGRSDDEVAAWRMVYNLVRSLDVVHSQPAAE